MKSICLDPVYSTTRLLTRGQSRSGRSFNEVDESQLTLCAGEELKAEGGLRTKGYSKSGYLKIGNQWYACDAIGKTGNPLNLIHEVSGTELPLITVVTVVFNGEKYLEETIQSVINQTYSNIEYIIIDGGSTDGTLDIIGRYENAIDYWVSERDNGIYDAMNKGIEKAAGNWINFMNAGDICFSIDTLELLFNAGTEGYDVDIIYGNVHVRYKDFFVIKNAGRLSRLWSGMIFCHQSSFVKTNFHKLEKFNPTNKIAADLEFFYNAYKRGARFKYKDIIISSVITGGVSESNRIKTILASRDAVCKSGGDPVIKAVYSFFCLDAMFRCWLKKILPKWISKKIIQMKS